MKEEKKKSVLLKVARMAKKEQLKLIQKFYNLTHKK